MSRQKKAKGGYFYMSEEMRKGKELPAVKDNKRLPAVDAIRGLAVIGMYIQHFALNRWNGFVSGNTMILFMLCSGISYTIMAGKMLEKDADRKSLNMRVLVRSVFLDLAGYVLIMLNGPFAVVLTAYAMLYLLALPFVRLETKRLLFLSGIAFLVCPPLMLIGMSLFEDAAVLSDIAGGPLSALAWMPVFFMGMAVGRFNLHKVENAIRFIASGVIILILAKLVEVFVMPGVYNSYMEWAASDPSIVNAEIDLYAMWPHNTQPVMWHMLFISTPQGGSTCELLVGTGGSLMLFGVLCLIGNKCGKLLRPFCNVGKLSLTLYVIQIVLGWALLSINTEWALALMDIGSIPFGGILMAIVVILWSMVSIKFKCSPFESLMRKFEKKFT